MNLEEATEIDLMLAWVKKCRKRGDKNLTRVGQTEVRHVCLYASQALQQLRTEVLRPHMTSALTIFELREIITDLEGLIGYLEGTKGAFSSMGDRNRR